MNVTFSHITNLWASLIIEALYHRGVKHLCIAPGSRSAPLTIAAAQFKNQHPDLTLHCHFDERGLGFFALGLSKSNQKPVAIITTSGTAVSNLHPSVIEAYQTQTPLIILSADRPPELLNCGANQAIQQESLFGRNVALFQQVDLPSESIPAQSLINNINQTLDHALGLTKDVDSGPVQINTPFREPLYGTNQRLDFSEYLKNCQFEYNDCPLKLRSQITTALLSPDVSSGLLIAGALTQKESIALLALSHKINWPILVDATSQLRLSNDKNIIHYTDLLLANNETIKTLSDIKQVIQFGGRLTSKRLNSWLASFEGDYQIISPHKAYLDPQHKATQIQSDISPFCESHILNFTDEKLTNISIKNRLLLLNSAIDEVIEQTLPEALSELSVIRQFSRLIEPNHALFLGNSLSIRMMDMVSFPAYGNPVYSNRGASGIDGLLATALGCSQQHPEGLTLLMGDLSLLHDLNSLAIASRQETPFIIIVLNNDGGAIFNLLPTSGLSDIKTTFFQCPHGFEFKGACDMFSINYNQPASLTAFADAYKFAQKHKSCSLIEINTPSNEATEQIKGLINEVCKLAC
jgi:2-succinyl-5-enolpyruvyl-6-hydroxy-3-cyclohexene-1-carboxylate synthase